MQNEVIERIRDALHSIPASDRDIWLRMGMGIKSEFGDAGFEAWDEWSQQDESYNRGEARSVWKSIRPNGGVTIRTVFHLAKVNGWRDDRTFRVPTSEELAERQRAAAAARTGREDREIVRERAATASRAAALWAVATEATPGNPYLQRKRVSPVATIREIEAERVSAILGYMPKSGGEPLSGCLLVVPVKVDGNLSTVELIDGAGRKAALAGRGSKSGGYWAAQPMPDGNGEGITLLVGEGVATVLSARQASGHPAIAALSNTNLRTVAQAMRDRYPEATLVILADLVKATGAPDPHAIDATRLAAGKLAIPNFGTDRRPSTKDFNDMAELFGAESVSQAIADARAPKDDVMSPSVKNDAPKLSKPTVELVRASDLEPESVDWLWVDHIPRGKLTVLAGAPGTGKTTIAMKIASTVTTGGRWPDGSVSPTGNVVIWSGEDDPQDTLIPRLVVAGADLSRVYFIATVRDGSERRPFDPARDMEPLRLRLAKIDDLRLLVVDPIVSAVAGDSHKNAEVRRALQPLVDLASASRCALFGITHFSKGTSGRDPVERLTGSLAFGALARVVLVATKSEQEDEAGRSARLFLRAKSNLGPDGGGFEYELQRGALKTHPDIFASFVEWGRTVDGTARALLATAEAVSDSGGRSELDDAKQFLVELLAHAPAEVNVIKEEANGAGHAWATVRRAQQALGIQSRKGGMKGPWHWELPRRCSENLEDAQTNVLSTFGKNEHLRDEDITVEVEI
jgi:putative DNA primase/helicase